MVVKLTPARLKKVVVDFKEGVIKKIFERPVERSKIIRGDEEARIRMEYGKNADFLINLSCKYIIPGWHGYEYCVKGRDELWQIDLPNKKVSRKYYGEQAVRELKHIALGLIPESEWEKIPVEIEWWD